jgi:hypothetical protein
VQTTGNMTEMTECEKLQLRNSPGLFEFYRALTGLHVVLVRYVQSGKISEDVLAYDENLTEEGTGETSEEMKARVKEATEACQALIEQFGGGCSPPATWDPATSTCA